MVHDLDRQRVEKLVAEDDDVLSRSRSSGLERIEHIRLPCRNVITQPLLQSLSQMGRLLHQRITQRVRELGKLLSRPVQHIARKQSATRAELDEINPLWRIKPAPH